MTISMLENQGPGIDYHGRLAGLLQAAQPGDIIYVDDSLSIRCDDGTAPKVLEINAGVTLASGRGSYRLDVQGQFSYSEGAKLFVAYDDAGVKDHFVRMTGENARLIGFRVIGHADGVTDPPAGLKVQCINVFDGNYVLIDSCEVSTPGHGIIFNGSRNSTVRNCQIHRHRRTPASSRDSGYSYGILLSGEPNFILVENNYFADNWHGVASDGCTDTGYEARGNFVDEGHGSAFDIHPHPLDRTNPHPCVQNSRDPGRVYDDSDPENSNAGTSVFGNLVEPSERITCQGLHNNCQYMYVHGNIFLSTYDPHSPTKPPCGVLLRGCPAQSCTIERNIFALNEGRAIRIGSTDNLDIGEKLIANSNTFSFVAPGNSYQFLKSLCRMLSPSLVPSPRRGVVLDDSVSILADRISMLERQIRDQERTGLGYISRPPST